jgi:hypothetical protein
MTQTKPNGSIYPLSAFWVALVINAIWINASEVLRYFAFIMPMLRETFPEIEGVAPMILSVFALWGVWDTILLVSVTGFVWLFLERFGVGIRQAVLGASLVWLAIFGILWIGMFNMNMATLEMLAIALPLSWIELVIAGLVVCFSMRRAARVHVNQSL